MHGVEGEPLRRESMTRGQLERRALIIDAVIALVDEVGSQAVQMREVSERSGVALGTVYRYFQSKEHLLAAAICDWHAFLTDRTLQNLRAADQDPRTLIASYFGKALRAFHRHPEMAALMVQLLASRAPVTSDALRKMHENDLTLLRSMLAPLPDDQVPVIIYCLNAILNHAVTTMATGRSSLPRATQAMREAVNLVVPAVPGSAAASTGLPK